MLSCPIELNFCMESMMPHNTTISSTLVTSMISISRRTFGWILEEFEDHCDVKIGYWNDAKSYINRFPDAILTTSSSTGRTVLHTAVAVGQKKIVKKLVKIGNKWLLKMQDKWGYTTLALAAELTDKKKAD